MEINIDNFLKETETFLAEEAKKNENRGNGNDSNYKVVYPGVPGGSLTVKLLWNQKSGTVIKQVKRHNGFGERGTTKIPCLSKYGIECPICNKMKEIEDKLGQSCGVNVHNAKIQSVAYAQLIDYNDKYTDMPAKGSIVLFMFPYTIYKQIMTLLNSYGQNSKQLIATNEGKPFIVKTDSKVGPNMYSVTVDPFNTFKSFGTDEEYFKCLENLPDLMEAITPKEVDENLMNRVNAAVDTLNAEFLGTPSDMQQPITQNTTNVQTNIVQNPNTVQPSTTIPNQNIQTASTTVTMEQRIEQQQNLDKPNCYGSYSMTEKKCLICPYGTDCADVT